MNSPSRPDPIRSWIEALDEATATRRLEEIDQEITALRTERSWLADAIALKRRYQDARSGSPASTGAQDEIALSAHDGVTVTDRAAVALRPVPDAHDGVTGTDRAAVAMRPVPDAHIPPPKGKAQAVERVLGSDLARTWAAQEIREEMVSRGWMTDEHNDFASLLSTLSRLVRERRIHRVRRGFYRLAPPSEADP